MLLLDFSQNLINNFNKFSVVMLFDEISLCIVLVEFLYFGSQFNSFVAVVNEFHENMLDIRFEKTEIHDDWHKSIHFLLENSPNLFFFS